MNRYMNSWGCITLLLIAFGITYFLRSILSRHDDDFSNSRLPICKPQTKIGFLKTHKTASSTVQNILLRYGYHMNLNQVLPSSGNHLSPVDTVFREEMLQDVPWHEAYKSKQLYNMLAIHCRWNPWHFRQLLGPDATCITILREPVAAFESWYSYARLDTIFNLTLAEFIKRGSRDSSILEMRHAGRGLNQQLYDLGLNPAEFHCEACLGRHIRLMEQEFDLVLIADKLEESLVLLADMLCLPLRYMASINTNKRTPSARVQLSPEEVSSLSSFQEHEILLYDHFSRVLDEKIAAYGAERMAAAVSELRTLNEQLRNMCVLKETATRTPSTRNQDRDKRLMGTVARTDLRECALAAMKEVQLINTVRQRQWDKWKTMTIKGVLSP